MDIPEYLRLVRRGWILLVVAALVGAAAGLVVSAAQPAKYSATAKAYVSTRSTPDIATLSQAATYAQQVIASYADVATSSTVLQRVINNLDLKTTPAALAPDVTVTAATGEAVLDIVVVQGSGAQAARVANGVADQLTTVVTGLTPTTGTAAFPVQIKRLDTAVAPTSPDSPKPALYALGGAVLLLILMFIALVLRELLDTRVRTEADVRAVTSTDALAITYRDNRVHSHAVVVTDATATPRSEAYLTLRANLQFLGLPSTGAAVVVTSSVGGEGKSTVAVNLAAALASVGQRVLLVDGDLRQPSVARYLGLQGTTGLAEVIVGRASLDSAIQAWGTVGLDVLTAGHVPANPNELIQSIAMEQLIHTMRGRYDAVVIDAPPLLPVSDAAILAGRTDGAIVVARAAHVHAKELTDAIGLLSRTGARTLGVVLGQVHFHRNARTTYASKGPSTLAEPAQSPAVTAAPAAPVAATPEPEPVTVPESAPETPTAARESNPNEIE